MDSIFENNSNWKNRNNMNNNSDDNVESFRLKQDNNLNNDNVNKLIPNEDKVEFEKKLNENIKEMNKPLKLKQIDILFRIYDFDLDNSIDFKEFVYLIRMYDIFGFLTNAT